MDDVVTRPRISAAGRSRFPSLNLSAGGDEITGERRRQLKLSFQPDCLKPAAATAAASSTTNAAAVANNVVPPPLLAAAPLVPQKPHQPLPEKTR